jgi:hypothetical protein
MTFDNLLYDSAYLEKILIKSGPDIIANIMSKGNPESASLEQTT